MDLSVVLTPALFDYHWLRRALHGALHRSCVAVVYPNLELICDFWPSKFSHYPSCPATLTNPVRVKQNTCKALTAANGTYYLNITENKDDFLEKCCDKH